MSTTVHNARAIQAALQRLQGPPAVGKLVVRAVANDGSPGPDVVLQPGTCASPRVGGALDRGATVFVRRNPATADAPDDTDKGVWTVTAAGTLVDVESLSGGPAMNQEGGTPYQWDPPVQGIELVSAADAGGITGGAYSGLPFGLKQFVHLKTMDVEAWRSLFAAQVYDYPAICLAWAGTTPLDGPMAGTPGPRTARAGSGVMLYRHAWSLFIVSSRLDSAGDRMLEGDTLRDDVIDVLFGARRVRDRVWLVSLEPGAEVAAAEALTASAQAFVDRVTLHTSFPQAHRPEPRDYHDWLRSRVRLQTPPQAPDPPIDFPNIVVPMPPNGPGTPPPGGFP